MIFMNVFQQSFDFTDRISSSKLPFRVDFTWIALKKPKIQFCWIAKEKYHHKNMIGYILKIRLEIGKWNLNLQERSKSKPFSWKRFFFEGTIFRKILAFIFLPSILQELNR